MARRAAATLSVVAIFLASVPLAAAAAQPFDVPPCELTLEAALAAAVAARPQLASVRAKAAQAEATMRGSRAALLPQVSGQLNYTRNTANFAGAPGSVPHSLTGRPVELSGASYNYFSAGLNLNQLIFDFGQSWGAYRAATTTAAAADADAIAALLDTELAVRNAYYTARAKLALADALRAACDNQARHRDQVEGFVAVGRRPEIDRLQARTDLANARRDALSAAGDAQVSVATLRQIIGQEGGPLCRPAATAPAPVAGEDAAVSELVAMALAARPDLGASLRRRDAARAALHAAGGGLWPKLVGQAKLTDAGAAPDALAWNWSVGLGLTWQLLAGGNDLATRDAARAALAAAEADLRTARLQVRLDVEQAQLAVATKRATALAADDAAANARQLLALAEGRYAAGAGGIIELGDAQVAATQATTQVVQAELELAQARAQLRRALGERSL